MEKEGGGKGWGGGGGGGGDVVMRSMVWWSDNRVSACGENDHPRADVHLNYFKF